VGVPRFDTDWAETGPLIERLRFKLEPSQTREGWAVFAYGPTHNAENAWGQTPLLAACALVLRLKAEGLLA
jgi:hypothetical protein